MKEIPLTQGKLAMVDDKDFDWLSQLKWRHSQGYATRSGPRKNYFRTTILMHRLILDAPDGIEVDHRNGNGLDNQRRNLRLCRRSQQVANGRKRSDGKTSRFRGVHFEKARGKYAAEITALGKKFHLGRYETSEAAAEAYNLAAYCHFGEFAKLNVITPPK